jgi:hypothetical protein
MTTGWIDPDELGIDNSVPDDEIGSACVPRHDGPQNPYIDPGDGGPRVPQIFHLDRELIEAFRRWSANENRSMSGQARVVLRDAIPAAFWPDTAP